MKNVVALFFVLSLFFIAGTNVVSFAQESPLPLTGEDAGGRSGEESSEILRENHDGGQLPANAERQADIRSDNDLISANPELSEAFRNFSRSPFQLNGSGENDAIPSFFTKINFMSLFEKMIGPTEWARRHFSIPISFILIAIGIALRLQGVTDGKALIYGICIPIGLALAAINSGHISDYCAMFGKYGAQAIYKEPPTDTIRKMLLFGNALLPLGRADIRKQDVTMTAEQKERMIENLKHWPTGKANHFRQELDSKRANVIWAFIRFQEEARRNGRLVKLASESNGGGYAPTNVGDAEMKRMAEEFNKTQQELIQFCNDNKAFVKVGDRDNGGWKERLLTLALEISTEIAKFCYNIFYGLAVLLIYGAVLVMILMFGIMSFFILLSTAFLPIFIAAFAVPALGSMAGSFVKEHISICLWPIGWAVGHIATPAIFGIAVETVSESAKVHYAFQDTLVQTGSSDAAWLTSLSIIAEAMEMDSMMTLPTVLVTVLLCLLLAGYTLFVALFMPKLINAVMGAAGNFVTSGFMQHMGGNLASSAIMRTVGAPASVVGKLAGGMASGVAAGTSGAVSATALLRSPARSRSYSVAGGTHEAGARRAANRRSRR